MPFSHNYNRDSVTDGNEAGSLYIFDFNVVPYNEWLECTLFHILCRDIVLQSVADGNPAGSL